MGRTTPGPPRDLPSVPGTGRTLLRVRCPGQLPCPSRSHSRGPLSREVWPGSTAWPEVTPGPLSLRLTQGRTDWGGVHLGPGLQWWVRACRREPPLGGARPVPTTWTQQSQGSAGARPATLAVRTGPVRELAQGMVRTRVCALHARRAPGRPAAIRGPLAPVLGPLVGGGALGAWVSWADARRPFPGEHGPWKGEDTRHSVTW